MHVNYDYSLKKKDAFGFSFSLSLHSVKVLERCFLLLLPLHFFLFLLWSIYIIRLEINNCNTKRRFLFFSLSLSRVIRKPLNISLDQCVLSGEKTWSINDINTLEKRNKHVEILIENNSFSLNANTFLARLLSRQDWCSEWKEYLVKKLNLASCLVFLLVRLFFRMIIRA